jgi:ribosomal protein S18 acetylase RimI-like enzyme
VSWFRSSRRRRSAASPEAAPEAAAQAVGLREEPFEAEAAGDEQATAVAVASPEELDGRPLADLHALAREHGIPRYRLLRKPELIQALGGRPAQSAPTVAPPEPARAAPERRTTRIATVDSASVDVLDALQRLVGELSSSAAKPNARDLEAIIESPVTTMIVARDQRDEVIGMLTLALFRIPSGLRAWIEDVVVDERARGEGVGEALTREAIRVANQRGARTIDLTSNRSREAANRMYRKLGFNRRDTTVYRIDSSG